MCSLSAIEVEYSLAFYCEHNAQDKEHLGACATLWLLEIPAVSQQSFQGLGVPFTLTTVL